MRIISCWPARGQQKGSSQELTLVAASLPSVHLQLAGYHVRTRSLTKHIQIGDWTEYTPDNSQAQANINTTFFLAIYPRFVLKNVKFALFYPLFIRASSTHLLLFALSGTIDKTYTIL